MLVLTRRTGEWLEFTVRSVLGGPSPVKFRLKLTEFARDRAKVVLDIPKEVEVKREGAGPKRRVYTHCAKCGLDLTVEGGKPGTCTCPEHGEAESIEATSTWPEPDLIDATRQRNQGVELQDREEG